MSDKKLVWIVEDGNGNIRSNWSTGTRIYTRLHNALARLGGWNKSYKVVEYELVPTGQEYDEKPSQ